MYYLTNFHADYPDAHVIIANCSGTISLSCQIESENNSSSIVRLFIIYIDSFSC
jgi:hypothetical protein